MCNEETLAIEQWLLLHETGVPHFYFFQVTGQLRIEDYYYAMRVFHKSWPACFKLLITAAVPQLKSTPSSLAVPI